MNRWVEFGPEGSPGDDRVREMSGRAGMEYDHSERWILNGSMTRFHQHIDGDRCLVPGRTGIPELSRHRLSAGFVRITE